MVGSTICPVRIEGTPARIRKMNKDVINRVSVLIRDTNARLYVGVPSQELGWLDKVCKDTGVKKTEIQEFPKYSKAKCGVCTTNVKQHEGHCNACRAIAGKEPMAVSAGKRKAHNSSAVTIAKIEPGQNFDLNGVVASAEITRDRLLEAYEKLDNLIKNLNEYKDIRDRIPDLEKEAVERMNAVKKLIGA